MQLSVVVPTLNGRDRLAACLDALTEHAPDAEVIVANGPSTDGTTGMVRDRDDVSVLIEISDRNLNVARNAGIETATGDVVALVGDGTRVEETWADAIRESTVEGVDVVTGPVHREVRAGMTTESLETRRIAGRSVTYFDGGNVAFSRDAVEAIDGFDEYLLTGGARDAAHRLAGLDYGVEWDPGVSVVRADERRADGKGSTDGGTEGEYDRDWGWKYRALAYRLTKNYGLRPTVIRRTFGHAGTDAVQVARGLATGEVAPSRWLANGREVTTNITIGFKDGLVARARDRTPRRNHRGISARGDRAVERYDWR